MKARRFLTTLVKQASAKTTGADKGDRRVPQCRQYRNASTIQREVDSVLW